jgi:hypothetical protein
MKPFLRITDIKYLIENDTNYAKEYINRYNKDVVLEAATMYDSGKITSEQKMMMEMKNFISIQQIKEVLDGFRVIDIGLDELIEDGYIKSLEEWLQMGIGDRNEIVADILTQITGEYIISWKVEE